MATLELEIGDERLDAQSVNAYFQRTRGRIQLWKTKQATLQAIDLKTVEGGLTGNEAARITLDLTTCAEEIGKLERELAMAQSGQINPATGKPITPGDARVALKKPSTNLNRNKLVG